MGAGIAQAFAMTDGFEVCLCDIKTEYAEGGKAKMWYECKLDAKPADVFDFQKFVKQALKKYGEAETTTMTADQAHALAALAGIDDSDVPTRPVNGKAKTAPRSTPKNP